MNNVKYQIMSFVLCIVLLSTLTCAVNPVTGKRELMLYSLQEELAIGKQTDAQVISQYGIYDNPTMRNYVSSLGKGMAPLTHRPDLPYSFKVLDTDVINAFAVPGGYVYFTRGILAYLNNEAELAGVVGHELGHITARHSMSQMSKAQLMQLGLGLGMALSEDFQKVAGLAGFGVQMLFLRFSRDNERQADDLGVEYASKTGYDANGMATFFSTLERMHPSEGAALPDWFSTHPNPVNRVAAVKSKTVEWQKKLPGKRFVANRSNYLKTIDGITFGPDPRQGYTENGIFYHPELLLQFNVPKGWQVINLLTQVQVAPESQDAALIFTIAEETTPKTAADMFVQKTAAVVESRSTIRVNQLLAESIQSAITSEQTNLKVESRFIKKGGKVYAFHGLSTPEKFASYQKALTVSMQSFRTLRDSKKINVKPDRLVLKKVKKSGTLRQALAGFGIKTKDQEQIALLNGMILNDRVKIGTMIKTVVKGRK